MRPNEVENGIEVYECFECGSRSAEAGRRRCEDCGGALRHVGRSRDL